MRSTKLELPSIILPRRKKKPKFITEYRIHLILISFIGSIIVSFNYHNLAKCCSLDQLSSYTSSSSSSQPSTLEERQHEYSSNDNKNSTSTSPSSDSATFKILDYHKSPSSFVNEFASCLLDEKCHIYYNHIAKTGGTSIEETMLHVFPFRFNDSGYSCCDDTLLRRFDKYKKQFCDHKFTAYQVNASSFQYVLETCRDIRPATTRAMVMLTYRDPAQRMLSDIHQLCNKNFAWRSPETQAMCSRCSYLQDRPFWNEYISKSNSIYTGIMTVIQNNLNGTILTSDNLDIHAFYAALKKYTPDDSHADAAAAWLSRLNEIPANTVSNTENTSTCNFHINPSTMLQLLYPSLDVYQYLVAASHNQHSLTSLPSNYTTSSSSSSSSSSSKPLLHPPSSDTINFHSFPRIYSKLFFSCFLGVIPNCKFQPFKYISSTDPSMFSSKNEEHHNIFPDWSTYDDDEPTYILLFYKNPLISYTQTIQSLCRRSTTGSNLNTTLVRNTINQEYQDILIQLQTIQRIGNDNTVLLLFDETTHNIEHFLQIMVNATLLKDKDFKTSDSIGNNIITTDASNYLNTSLLSTCFSNDSGFISSSLLKELSASYVIYRNLASY